MKLINASIKRCGGAVLLYARDYGDIGDVTPDVCWNPYWLFGNNLAVAAVLCEMEMGISERLGALQNRIEQLKKLRAN